MLAFCFLWISGSSWFETIWEAGLWPVGLGWLLGSSLLHSQLLQPLAPHPKSHRGTGNRGLRSICNGVTWLPISLPSSLALPWSSSMSPWGSPLQPLLPWGLQGCFLHFFPQSPPGLSALPSQVFPEAPPAGLMSAAAAWSRVAASHCRLPQGSHGLSSQRRACARRLLVWCARAKSHHCMLLWHKRVFNKVCDLFWGHTSGFPGVLTLI